MRPRNKVGELTYTTDLILTLFQLVTPKTRLSRNVSHGSRGRLVEAAYNSVNEAKDEAKKQGMRL
jgi:hypothetical protein